MQINHDVVVSMAFIYEQAKFWVPCLAFSWGVYKGFDKAFKWVKEIREKDLAELKTSVDGLKGGINETNTAVQNMQHGLSGKIESQTVSIVDQLKELRSDFRTFYTIPTPQMIPARAKPVKTVKKKATVRKQTAKTKSK